MALRLGDTVPDFTQDSQLGPINLYDSAPSGRSATSKPSP